MCVTKAAGVSRNVTRISSKDRIIFVTKEDHETPTTVELPEDPNEEKKGLILPNGDINWNCPCLGGMASGPCGTQFREAFSCFHYSKTEPKGSDCFEKFREMQLCMGQYPNLYPVDKDGDDEENFLDIEDTRDADAASQSSTSSTEQNKPKS